VVGGRGTSEDVDCRIVYAGPAGSGKSTILRAVHDRLDPDSGGTLLSPVREDGSTPFMDMVSVNAGALDGRPLRLLLLTVPGGKTEHGARNTILSAADGVVFVADSAADRMQANREAVAGLRSALERLAEPGSFPLVFQYNKRDLESALPVERLDQELNPEGYPRFSSIAKHGEGVVAPLTAVSERVIRALA
jgi:signal recognition particle receptor subunit beta